jgi:hypothetical protein
MAMESVPRAVATGSRSQLPVPVARGHATDHEKLALGITCPDEPSESDSDLARLIPAITFFTFIALMP